MAAGMCVCVVQLFCLFYDMSLCLFCLWLCIFSYLERTSFGEQELPTSFFPYENFLFQNKVLAYRSLACACIITIYCVRVSKSKRLLFFSEYIYYYYYY